MRSAPGRVFLLLLGLIMVGLGLFVAVRPLIAPGRPLTGQRWLDLVFALFFLARGAWNVRVATRTPRGPAGPAGPTPGA